MSPPENRKVLVMGLTVEAVAQPAPAITLSLAVVINLRQVGAMAEETIGMEMKDVGSGRRGRRVTPLTLIVRVPHGADAATPHLGVLMPRFGNGRGRLLSINLEN